MSDFFYDSALLSQGLSNVGWLFWDLTALWDSISVYIRPSPREREKEERDDRWEKTIIQVSKSPRLSKEEKRSTYWILRGYAFKQTPEWKKLSSQSFPDPSDYLSSHWSLLQSLMHLSSLSQNFPFGTKTPFLRGFFFCEGYEFSMFPKSDHDHKVCLGNVFRETDQEEKWELNPMYFFSRVGNCTNCSIPWSFITSFNICSSEWFKTDSDLLSRSGQAISLKLKFPRTWTEGSLLPLRFVLIWSSWSRKSWNSSPEPPGWQYQLAIMGSFDQLLYA